MVGNGAIRWRPTYGARFIAAGRSEVVSVRVEPQIEAALQEAAEPEWRHVANMLEVMGIAHCEGNG